MVILLWMKVAKEKKAVSAIFSLIVSIFGHPGNHPRAGITTRNRPDYLGLSDCQQLRIIKLDFRVRPGDR